MEEKRILEFKSTVYKEEWEVGNVKCLVDSMVQKIVQADLKVLKNNCVRDTLICQKF